MTRAVPWDFIIELVGRYPEGASLEEVMLGLSPAVPRRTVQRWLAHLVKNRQIIGIGRTRARRYRLPGDFKEEIGKSTALIPLSKEGQKIESAVSQPIQKRRPVGYDREFLEKYLPNQTFYLSEELRKKLKRMGGGEGGQYPAGTYARQIFHRLLIDLAWNSSRLEGNTYSLLETERLVELGKSAEGKTLRETQMILNHKAAVEFMILSATEIGVNRFTILNLHTLLSDNLLPDPAAGGRLRTFPVGIEKSIYLPTAIPQVIEECFDLVISKAKQIRDPFEQSFFLMVQLPYLQPFDDVNKRTSRLAANIPLIRNNLSPLSFIDVPERTYIDGLLGVYERNRIELLRDVYEWAYERSCALYSTVRKSLGDPDPFRMRYREAIIQAVKEIVHNQMDKTHAIAAIRAQSNIAEADRAQFTHVVERELQSLHEGNIVRYHLRQTEYEDWKKRWH